jgi:hypothetical protein
MTFSSVCRFGHAVRQANRRAPQSNDRLTIHLLATASGIPVEWIFLPGSAHDTRGLFSLAFHLPVGSEIYADKGYTDYLVEDCLSETDALALMALRKQRSTRPDRPLRPMSSEPPGTISKPYLAVLPRFSRK